MNSSISDSFPIDDDVFDIIIVGAGPAGLAVASRLRERTPAALFTDEEHRRFHWINKYGKDISLKKVIGGQHVPKTSPFQQKYRMAILDAEDDKWLGRWNRLFKTYDISHLRSPMLWHVDPQERDSLVAHAWTHQRENELVEIKSCVGQEISKHAKKKKAGRQCGARKHARELINAREHYDYYRPSRSLFGDHCEMVAERYGLTDGIIAQEILEDLDYGSVADLGFNGEKLFTLSTNKGTHYARVVILATGPASKPQVPQCPSMPSGCLPQACHSMDIDRIPDSLVRAKIIAKQPTNVLVVGGGLTSAQITDLALRQGVSKVWHIMRGPVKLKHFDVSLEWMGKYRNTEHARFWLADSDDERWEIIQEARQGGSMTDVFYKKLQKHIRAERLDLRTHTKLVDAKFVGDESQGHWTIATEPPVDNMPPIDYIYFATGVQTDFSALPYLQNMQEKYPIKDCGGLPCLTEDLTWSREVPMFMAGKLASLQVGPSGPNVGGAKLCAERIAWAIEAMARRKSWCEEYIDSENDEKLHRILEYSSGHGNRFGVLGEEL